MSRYWFRLTVLPRRIDGNASVAEAWEIGNGKSKWVMGGVPSGRRMRFAMRVSGSVRFGASVSEVFAYLARTVLAHAVEQRPDDDTIAREGTVLTRYATKLGPLTVVTTEEATLTPGRSITWRHVDGPLTGSVETFEIGVSRRGGTVVRYTGDIRARNRWLRGPLEGRFVAPLTRMVSMGALRDARRALEGEQWREEGLPLG
jgi:hypothetical protein